MQSGQAVGWAWKRRSKNPDRRRRICRPGSRLRRGEDHARARLQRLRGRPPARSAARQHHGCGSKYPAPRQRGFSEGRAAPRRELAETIEALDGLDRFTARDSVVAMMEERELIEKTDEHTHTVPHGDRERRADRAVPDRPVVREREGAGGAGDRQRARRAHRSSSRRTGRRPISTGWRTSSPGASRASSGGATAFPPGTARTAKSSSRRRRRRPKAAAYRHYGVRQKLDRDEDVLDTWFSSALWPFSTLGWPEETPELKRYYPTSVLVTGFDIIFFWVARMMMMGLHFMKEEPFHTRLHPRHRARREGRQDVEVEGERRRSPRADRRVRRRRAPLHDGVAGDARRAT